MEKLRLYVAVAALNLFVACKPMPSPRRIQAKTGISYMPPEYSRHTAECQKEFHRQTADYTPFEGDCAVFIEIVGETPKSTKLTGPRGDVDNFAKTYMDAITKSKRVWVDDTQVKMLAVLKRWAKPGEAAGAHLSIIPIP